MRREVTNTLLLQAEDPATSHNDRLPKNVKPIHYNLVFEPDLEHGSYIGSVMITLEALEETSSITLNLRETKVTRFAIHVPPSKDIWDLLATCNPEDETITIILCNDKVLAGEIFVLEMEFEGSLDSSRGGFFRSSYLDPNSGENKWISSTQMEPVEARKAFPCFDEPALKATFQIKLVADHHLTCLANMDVSHEYDMYSPVSNRRKKAVIFHPTPLMSTYLVSFAVGELNMLETNEWRVPIRIYATLDEPIENARFALEVSALAMKHHEHAFDVKYPLPKLDQIQTPGNMGGMENWGLVTYAPGFLMHDPKTASASEKQLAVEVITHELAHQWFGNIVTMEFWDGLWLNESFASWAQSHVQEQMFPEIEYNRCFLTEKYQRALDMDSSRASHPIQVPVKRAGDFNQIFDDISYCKGESILRMLADYIGIEKFLRGVRLYLFKHAFGNSVTTELWESLSEICGLDVESFMSNWTTKIGYPVLTVLEGRCTGKGDFIDIVQHRFLKTGPVKPDEDSTSWFIPVNILTESGIQSTTLSRESTRIWISKEFFKLNAGQSGFYRVAYTPRRLAKLGQAAQKGLIPVEDRIGLISDATALASSGFHATDLTPTISLLNLLNALSNEPNYFVWKQILSSLSTIRQAFLFHPLLPKIFNFQKHLTTQCLENQCWDFIDTLNPPKDDNLKLFQVMILNAAGEAGNEDVVTDARKLFGKWMEGDESAVMPDTRDSIFALAIRNGGPKEFNHLLNLYTASLTSPQPPSVPPPITLLTALGHTSDPLQIKQLLDMWLKLDIQEGVRFRYAIKSIVGHARGAEMVWEFVKMHYEELLDRVSGIMGQRWRFVHYALRGLGTREQVEDVKGFFFGGGRDLTGFDIVLRQSIESMETKASWVERDEKNVGEWLEVNGFGLKQEDL